MIFLGERRRKLRKRTKIYALPAKKHAKGRRKKQISVKIYAAAIILKQLL